MNMRWALGALLLVGAQEDEEKPRRPFVPTEQYEKRSIEGWTVYVNKVRLDPDHATGRAALCFFETKLWDIRRAVQEKGCAGLEHHDAKLFEALKEAWGS